MATPQYKLVRLPPAGPRKVHVAFGVTIKAEEGWKRYPAAIVDQLAKERLNELNPAVSSPVFEVRDDVTDAAEVAAVVREEAAQAPGTLANPREGEVPPTLAPEKPARRGRAPGSG